ncbi:hypothetical protein LTR85_002579 [Meristemomyces frigidus]|nr:hypothetical protein LTR85_002579 [Meristemomyces frigidus]
MPSEETDKHARQVPARSQRAIENFARMPNQNQAEMDGPALYKEPTKQHDRLMNSFNKAMMERRRVRQQIQDLRKEEERWNCQVRELQDKLDAERRRNVGAPNDPK